MGQSTVLVATLGSEPQVVTLTLDLLAAQGIEIEHTLVLHSSPETNLTRDSLLRLIRQLGPTTNGSLAELEANVEPTTRYSGLTWETVCFSDADGTPLEDITTQDHALVAFQTIFRTLELQKERGHTIHFSAAGGRKAMAMYAMLAAQLLFEEDDRLWNLVSTAELIDDRRPHARPGEASLLRIPVLPWRIGLPQKTTFLRESLTAAEAEVLELVARNGLTDREVALHRGTSPKTTSDQLSAIYQKLRAFLGYRDDVIVSRATLLTEFGPYFDIIDALGYGRIEGAATHPEYYR